jgi:hypothetical protein
VIHDEEPPPDSPDDTVGITHEFIDRVEAWL